MHCDSPDLQVPSCTLTSCLAVHTLHHHNYRCDLLFPRLPAALYLCLFTDVAESIGRELLVYGRRIPKAEMFARIDAVDADTVRAVADRFIYDQDVAIAAVGDTQFLPDYNW